MKRPEKRKDYYEKGDSWDYEIFRKQAQSSKRAWVVAGVSGAIAILAMLAVVLVLNVIQRAANFPVSRPAREVLFTLLPMEWRYRSRTLIDTLVYRGSDVIGIWLVTGLFAVGLPLAGTAAVAVPIAAFWTYLNRRTARIIQLHEKETGNERQV